MKITGVGHCSTTRREWRASPFAPKFHPGLGSSGKVPPIADPGIDLALDQGAPRQIAPGVGRRRQQVVQAAQMSDRNDAGPVIRRAGQSPAADFDKARRLLPPDQCVPKRGGGGRDGLQEIVAGIRGVSIRRRGASRGRRLFDVASIRAFLRAQMEN